MGIWQWVKEITVKTFLPWFKEFVWPIIKKHFEEMVASLINKFRDVLMQWIEEWTRRKEDRAYQRADEFEQKAKTAEPNHEKEKYQAMAKVWREIAEQFRQENEDLIKKIDEITMEVKEDSNRRTSNLELDFDFSDQTPVLLIGGKGIDLPALPSSNKRKE